MGGIGKTVLAKALTDDEVVQRAFPDGIVWITGGKRAQARFHGGDARGGQGAGRRPQGL
jgi:hypothetical protein